MTRRSDELTGWETLQDLARFSYEDRECSRLETEATQMTITYLKVTSLLESTL